MPLQQYVEQKYGEDWIENPEAVRFVEGVMMIDVALVAGLEIPTSIPISMLPGNWMGDHCCWICGDADHLSYQCPVSPLLHCSRHVQLAERICTKFEDMRSRSRLC